MILPEMDVVVHAIYKDNIDIKSTPYRTPKWEGANSYHWLLGCNAQLRYRYTFGTILTTLMGYAARFVIKSRALLLRTWIGESVTWDGVNSPL